MKSLIGEIPHGWLQVMLAEVCEPTAGPSGAALRPDDFSGVGPDGLKGSVPVVTPKDIREGRIAIPPSSAVGDDVANELTRYRLLPDDVVGVRTGTLARHALVGEEQRGWLFNTGCFRLRIKAVKPAPISARYLCNYLNHDPVAAWLRQHATSTTVPSLSMKTLGTLPVVLPPLATQEEVCQVLSALDEKIRIHEQISATTRQLRHTLLPSLISGSYKRNAA